MSATEDLRRMLDERGVKHYDMQYSYATEVLWGGDTFGGGGAKFTAYEQTDGFICLEMADLTPEQAIAATLGAGTCRNVHEPPKNTTFWLTPHFKCSECGAVHVSMDYVYFCPNCGRRVVDE